MIINTNYDESVPKFEYIKDKIVFHHAYETGSLMQHAADMRRENGNDRIFRGGKMSLVAQIPVEAFNHNPRLKEYTKNKKSGELLKYLESEEGKVFKTTNKKLGKAPTLYIK